MDHPLDTSFTPVADDPPAEASDLEQGHPPAPATVPTGRYGGATYVSAVYGDAPERTADATTRP